MLNFKDWVKVAEDKHSTTMRHASGHIMTLINKSMPSIQREQLKRLKLKSGTPDGTVGDEDDDADDSSDTSTDSPSPTGSSSSDSSSSPASPSPAPAINMTINAASPPASASGQTPDTTQAPPVVQSAQQPLANTQPASQQQAQQQGSTQSPAVGFANQPVDVQVPQVQSNLPAITSQNGQPNPAAMNQNLQAAGELKRDSSIAQGKAMADVEAGYQTGVAQNNQKLQDANDLVRDQAMSLRNYNDQNPIDPNHWAESQSTAQQVKNGLALFLGGFGQRKTGVNPAMNWINNQIDRDIKAQQQRFDNQKTVYGSIRQLYGDTLTTTNQTRVAMRDIYDSKAKQIAYQLNTPEAYSNYLVWHNDAMNKNNLDMKNSAVNIAALPGYHPLAQAQPSQGNQSQGSPSQPQSSQPAAPTPQASQPMPTRAGAGGSWGNEDDQSAPTTSAPSYYDTHVLKPGAQNAFNQIQAGWGNPEFVAQKDDIKDQWTQVKNAEKAAQDVGPLFDGLNDAVQKGGVSGRLGRAALNSATGIAAGIGSAIGTLAGHPAAGAATGASAGQMGSVFNTENNRDIKDRKSAITKYVATALSKTKLGQGAIEEFMDSHTPEYGDSPKRVANLKNEFIHFILNAPERDRLEAAGLAVSPRPLKLLK